MTLPFDGARVSFLEVEVSRLRLRITELERQRDEVRRRLAYAEAALRDPGYVTEAEARTRTKIAAVYLFGKQEANRLFPEED